MWEKQCKHCGAIFSTPETFEGHKCSDHTRQTVGTITPVSLNGCSYCGNGECAVCGRKLPQMDDVLHGLDLAEIFAIKNAHALNAGAVLSAIKDAQAIIRSAK